MKRTLIFAATMLSIAVCFTFCTGKTSATASDPGGTTDTTKPSKILEELGTAFFTGDKKVYDQYLADDYIRTDQNGKVTNKGEVLDNLRTPPASIHIKGDVTQLQVNEHGSTTIMNYLYIMQETSDADTQKIVRSYRVTDTYLQSDKSWKLSARHFSEIPAVRPVAKINPSIYDKYIGEYEMAPGYTLTLTRDDDKLMAIATGQTTKWELLPESETIFFQRDQPAKTLFVKDAKGIVTQMVTLAPDGKEFKSKKIN